LWSNRSLCPRRLWRRIIDGNAGDAGRIWMCWSLFREGYSLHNWANSLPLRFVRLSIFPPTFSIYLYRFRPILRRSGFHLHSTPLPGSINAKGVSVQLGSFNWALMNCLDLTHLTRAMLITNVDPQGEIVSILTPRGHERTGRESTWLCACTANPSTLVS